ncbi:transposase, ISL3 family [Candidatus Burkholderia pumila]|uniref:Transposase, ISL3 family n=1 Tax=Candidatus Burkholderia pumila TaxID=1090375 RepID=A0ABR5HJU2_9BURK|nr:transposase, ISL3 family [Candidatus Burkholderia pumila]
MQTNILNLANYRVLKVEEAEHDYHVSVETQAPVVSCVYCQSEKVVGFGRREQLVKDLLMHGKRVGMYVSTRRLSDWIGKQSVKRTFASIVDEVGVVEGTVRSSFRDYVNGLEQHIRFETPKWMGSMRST